MPDNKNDAPKRKSKYIKDSEQKSTSKYFKSDDSQKNASKYFKEEGEQKKSKYLKTDDDRRADKERFAAKTDGTSTYFKTAAPGNLDNRQRQKKARANADNLPQEATSIEDVIKGKGDQKSLFSKKEADKSAKHLYREAERTPDESRRRRTFIRTAIIIFVLFLASFTLNFAQMHFSFLPSFLNIEFSAIPEYIASLAYGPVVGFGIILVKNVIMAGLRSPVFVPQLSNLILDTSFVFVGGIFYTRRMFTFREDKKLRRTSGHRDIRIRRILLGGLLGTICNSIATFFTTRYISYPLFDKFFGEFLNTEKMMNDYQLALEGINTHLSKPFVTEVGSLSKAVLIFNVPLTFLKFMFITIIVAAFYPPITDFLHDRATRRRR
ncbi:MAG: hypothetical protein IJS03_03375 [Eubacterium sp.]|nr:hypothetical protein [Eubacterium sp.]